MADCEGCGAPIKPRLVACDYCRRAYPHDPRVAAIDERALMAQYTAASLQNLANQQNAQNCNSYQNNQNNQNNLLGMNNLWGWR